MNWEQSEQIFSKASASFIDDGFCLSNFVFGIDEVGRGALAGPVCVGVAVIERGCGPAPEGVGDSKKLTPAVRERLCAPIRQWVHSVEVGYASAEEIDMWGIVTAQRLAARRAFDVIAQKGITPDFVILDGPYNWLRMPTPQLLWPDDHPDLNDSMPIARHVVAAPKADDTCTVVSAAAIVAKVHRDKYMENLNDELYGWGSNKGYGSAKHLQAIRQYGPSKYHRRSWKLPDHIEEMT